MKRLMLVVVLGMTLGACFEDDKKKALVMSYWDTYQQRAVDWRQCMIFNPNKAECATAKALMDQAENEYRMKAAQ